MLNIQILPLGELATNCYLVSLPGQNEVVVIDPGDDKSALQTALQGKTVAGVLITHAHYDHILGLPVVKDAPIYVHEADAPALTDEKLNYAKAPTDISATHLVHEGDVISLAGMDFTVLHTPGHSMGSVCYGCGDDLFTGDTIFAHGYGRTDLYGGSWRDLVASMRRLLRLPGQTHIYPGHGGDTTLDGIRGNA